MQSTTAETFNVFCHWLGGERPRRYDGDTVADARSFLAYALDKLAVSDLIGYILREKFAVDGERASGGYARGVRRLHNERAAPSHFFFEQSYRVRKSRRSQRIGADEFGKLFGSVRGGVFLRLHFVKFHENAAARRLPSRFTAGKTCAYNGYFTHCSFFKGRASFSNPQPSERHTSVFLPFLRKSVLPHFGHFSAVGISHDEKLHFG